MGHETGFTPPEVTGEQMADNIPFKLAKALERLKGKKFSDVDEMISSVNTEIAGDTLELPARMKSESPEEYVLRLKKFQAKKTPAKQYQEPQSAISRAIIGGQEQKITITFYSVEEQLVVEDIVTDIPEPYRHPEA